MTTGRSSLLVLVTSAALLMGVYGTTVRAPSTPSRRRSFPGPRFKQAEHFAVSRPTGVAVRGATSARGETPLLEGDDEGEIHNRRIRTGVATSRPASTDLAVQSSVFSFLALMPPATLTFEGLSNDDNSSLLHTRVLPPDTNGDVGPRHYVQMVNLAYRVFDK